MRAFRFLNLAFFTVLVAGSVALYTQDDKQQPQQDDKPRQEQQDDTKTPRQDEVKPPKQDKNEPKQNEQKPEEMKSDRQDAQQEHARPAGKSGHIPDDKFRAQFGRTHTFHPQRPEMVNGQPRFQYGGYSFVLIDAWPAGWAYTDDCYVDYIDGEYFLFDLLHPGVRIALFVVL